MGDTIEELLESIYFDPKSEGSFGGLKKLYNAAIKKDLASLMLTVKINTMMF